MRFLAFFLAVFSCASWAAAQPREIGKVRRNATHLPQCKDVVLHAAYLAQDETGQGGGFLISIENYRNTPIEVEDPPAISVHWYALNPGSRPIWRASSGAGGGLVNAAEERGAVFAAQAEEHSFLLAGVPAHSARSWAIFQRETPAVRYRPGCEHCLDHREDAFIAILGYAVLPPHEQEFNSSLSRCGLRSGPVAMPPLRAVDNLDR